VTAAPTAAGELAAELGATKSSIPNCFTAGTPLLTPTGSKAINELVRGDLVLSRDQNDVAGVVESKMVEEVFASLAKVIQIHVGGQVINSTVAHPFWVQGKGWLPARELIAGDRLVGHDGQWSLVKKVVDADEWATVYNVRVDDFHTYFVGCDEWGFSVWAHNTSVVHVVEARGEYYLVDKATRKPVFPQGERTQFSGNRGVL
jgi:hypothetical protein